MNYLIESSYKLYVKFLIWLGAEPPEGFESPNKMPDQVLKDVPAKFFDDELIPEEDLPDWLQGYIVEEDLPDWLRDDIDRDSP